MFLDDLDYVTYSQQANASQDWRSLFRGLLKDKLYEDCPTTRSFLRTTYGIGQRLNTLPFLTMIIACKDTYPIAVGTASATQGEEPLVNLYVRPQYGRQGLGTRLLMLLQDRHPLVQGVWTRTATRLYQKRNVDELPLELIKTPYEYACHSMLADKEPA